MNRLLLSAFFVLSTGCTATELMCFESTAVDPAMQSEWTHHYYLLSVPPATLSVRGGVRFTPIHGVGYDDAPTPNGGTDMSPISGGAAEDVDGTWIVNLVGTLHQKSLGQFFSVEPYYVISESWVLNPDLKQGTARVGNLTRDFMFKLIPGANDDYYEAEVWSVPCETLR